MWANELQLEARVQKGKMASRAQKKRRGRVIPCLGLRARLPSTALQILQQLFSGEDALLCRHRREPCFSPTCWQFSEMQGTPGQKQAS